MASSAVMAGTFPLTDGSKIEGTPETIIDKGVVFQLAGGDVSARITWDRFTPEALKELMAEARTDAQREILQPMVQYLPQPGPKPHEFTIKPLEPPFRPKNPPGIFGLFASSLGWVILIILYGANLFAAYEVSVYRRQPPGMVIGLAAIPFLGVLSPVIFGAMPTQYPPPEPVIAPPTPEELAAQIEVENALKAQAAVVAQQAAAAAAPTKPVLPEPISFKRGDFNFNRRFIETKFASFFRVVPSEADKDLVLAIDTARGKFVGRRISKITQSELYLLTGTSEVSAEEMIPFTEINEIQIRHKDLP